MAEQDFCAKFFHLRIAVPEVEVKLDSIIFVNLFS